MYAERKHAQIRARAHTHTAVTAQTCASVNEQDREKFDPTVYLKNPMVLMGLMAAFMAFVMPKMVTPPMNI